MQMLSIPAPQGFFLAQALPALLLKLGLALKVLMAFGFFAGVIAVMSGAAAIRRGEDGKPAIFAGILISSSPAIMYALFEIFLGAGVAPQF